MVKTKKKAGAEIVRAKKIFAPKKLQAALLGFAYTTLGLSPAFADDTDIFFGGVSANVVKPNVLFILDNSESMTNKLDNSDAHNPSRMAILKRSFRSIMSSTTGINAGIMRFNDPGGSILFPVTDIDASYAGDAVLRPAIAESRDDAYESLASGGGSGGVNSTGDTLSFGFSPLTTMSFKRRILARNDDAEEETDITGWGSHRVMNWGTQFNIRYSQTNALRFRNLPLNNDSVILNANILFTSGRNSTGELDLEFVSEISPDSAAFVEKPKNITDRLANKSSTSVQWSPTEWVNYGQYPTPDLSPLVQEVISNPSWGGGSKSITFIQTYTSNGSVERDARTYNRDPDRAPLLQVNYYDPATTPSAELAAGMRFQNVGIPQGATVTRAYIEVTPKTSSIPGDPLQLDIAILDAPDANPFSNSVGAVSSPGGTYSPSTVSWNPGDWVQNQPVQTTDLTSMVQQVVNRTDWCGGNAMLFKFQPDNSSTYGLRHAYSFDAAQSRQPRLVIEYDPNSVPDGSCKQVILTRQIDASANDAEQFSNGNVDNNDDNGDGINMQSSQTNAFLFENLPLKQGADILEASLSFTAFKNDKGDATMEFRIQNSVDPQNFAQNRHDISNRPTTGKSMRWSSSSTPALTNWIENGQYRSPDISHLIQDIVDNPAWDPVDNGLAFIQRLSNYNRRTYSYDNSSGGGAKLQIKVQSSDLTDNATGVGLTIRDHLITLVDELDPVASTPIADSLYEAARYYRGDSVYWAKKRKHPGIDSNKADRLKRVSHLEAIRSGTGTLSRDPHCTDKNLDNEACSTEEITGNPIYKSPIIEGCQSNYIVLLTDGEANQNHSQDLIKSYITANQGTELTPEPKPPLDLTSCSRFNNSSGEQCSEELVRWLASDDQAPGVAGLNKVNTFTIAFALDQNSDAYKYLGNLAHEGDGTFYEAGSEAALSHAFNQIIQDVLSTDATFVVPGVSVSQFNLLTNLEDVYFAVFKPAETPRWRGNLKKYKIATSGTHINEFIGQNGQLAVDKTTGFFSEQVTSFWSGSATKDGPYVDKGGAAFNLPDDVDARNVYTFYPGADKALKNNPLDYSNASITKSVLGITGRPDSDNYRRKLLNQTRGEIVDGPNIGQAHKEMGDPLHASPVTIGYGDINNPDFTVFLVTNEGYLHAFDSATGQEQFAFMPEELLPMQQILFDNVATDKHPYGLDGSITTWINDNQKDGLKSSDPLDHAYLYFGMRRGGDSYYAIDVTDRSNPKYMWRIDGGVAPYQEMGQTWSQPTKARIAVKESGAIVIKEVLIMGGGYDTDQDLSTERQKDNEGRAIFMVDANPKSGSTLQAPDLIWSAGKSSAYNLRLPNMEYSIPGAVKAGDTNGDGLADIMFVADMGGQIWRFDINNGATVDNLVTGGVIADLAADNSSTDGRRFYADVDASTFRQNGETAVALTIGSGWRANPLSEIHKDRFYMIKQSFSNQTTYTKLDESNLYDATSNLAQSTDPTVRAQALIDLKNAAGWYIKLPGSGEKVLSQSLVFQNQVFFSSYEPGSAVATCNAVLGTGYLWGVNLFDATGIFDVGGNMERKKQLASGNIPPQPTLIVTPAGKPVISEAAELEEPPHGELVNKTYWYQPE